MSKHIYYSQNKNIDEVINEIKEKFKNLSNNVMLYFISIEYNQKEFAYKLKKEFINSNVIGCSTAGEIADGKLLSGSVVVKSLNNNLLYDNHVIPIKNMDEFINHKIKRSCVEFRNYFKEDIHFSKSNNYVGVVLLDGLSYKTDKLIEKLSFNSNIVFVGGSAGDNLEFDKTFVHCNGDVYDNGAVLLLIKPKVNFDIIKHQHFEILNKEFHVTKADPESRIIYSLNRRPAAIEYAKSIGKPLHETEKYFMEHPFGLVINNNEPYVRSLKKINFDDCSIECYSSVPEGVELNLMKGKRININQNNDGLLEYFSTEFNSVSDPMFMIAFNCFHRRLFHKKINDLEDYKKIFSYVPTIGFDTYGEEYLSHINQSLTALILGKN